MVLGVNSAVAAGKGSKSEVAFYLFAIGAVIVTSAALVALSNGRRMCTSYHESLIKMYKENGVFDYYPADGEKTGKLRNWLYTVVVLACGLLAIVVPILVRS
jgi:hypothetical protein